MGHKTCQNCGQITDSQNTFCPHCGTAQTPPQSEENGIHLPRDVKLAFAVGCILSVPLFLFLSSNNETQSSSPNKNDATSQGYIYTTVNVRSGPSTDTEVVDQLNRGDIVEYAPAKGKWVKLKNDASTPQYVHAPLVHSSPLPIPAAPQAQCHNLIEKILKSPSSADFPFLPDTKTLANGPNYYGFRISGNVDAENSFGGTLRKSYSCILWTSDNSRQDSIEWNVGRVVLGGQVFVENTPFPWE